VSGFFLLAPCEGFIDEEICLFYELTFSLTDRQNFGILSILDINLHISNILLMVVSIWLGIKLLDIITTCG